MSEKISPKKLKSKISKYNQEKKIDKINPPIEPEYVFFGLIDVNLGPPKIFPNKNPPKSDPTLISRKK